MQSYPDMDIPAPNSLFPRSPDELHEWSTILSAAQIEHHVVDDGFGVQILLPAGVVERAKREIALVVAQNENWPPTPAPIPEPALARDRWPATPFVIVGVLLALFLWTGPFDAGNRLLVAAASNAQAFRGGEWWRVFTALGIHGDTAHLVGNLVFLGCTSLFVCRRLGDGLGALLILLGGGLGNFIMASLSSTHLSVGASTANFAALGILVGVATTYYVRREPLNTLWTKAWIPIGAAVALFGWTGVGEVYYDMVSMPKPHPEDNTDIGAHFFGLVAGFALGLPFGWRDKVQFPIWLQAVCGFGAMALFAFAWRSAMVAGFGG